MSEKTLFRDLILKSMNRQSFSVSMVEEWGCRLLSDNSSSGGPHHASVHDVHHVTGTSSRRHRNQNLGMQSKWVGARCWRGGKSPKTINNDRWGRGDRKKKKKSWVQRLQVPWWSLSCKEQFKIFTQGLHREVQKLRFTREWPCLTLQNWISLFT